MQKGLQEDIPFKVLAAGNEPDFRTISDFRKIHIERYRTCSSRS
jgi:transposase